MIDTASSSASPPDSAITARHRSPHRFRDWPMALAVGTVAMAIGAFVQRVWVGSFAVPLRYAGDSVQVLLTVQGIQEGEWYYENSRVGAPFGLEQYDFPDGGHIQFASFKVVGWLTGGDAALTFNITYLLGFLAISAVGYWVLRRLDVAKPWAAAVAILYSLLPYHLLRIGHHYLSLYVAVPLAILLVMRQAQGHAAFVVERDGRRRLGIRWRDAETRVALVAGLVIGLTGPYYALFAGMLLLAVAVLAFFAERDRVRLASTLLVAAVIGGTLTLSLTPTIVYRLVNGANSVAARPYSDVERYALKPLLLVLPIENHRIELLRAPMQRALTAPTSNEHRQNLGLVGAIGLTALVLAGLSSVLAGAGRVSSRTRLLAGLVIGMMMGGLIGGYGALLGVFGFTQIRAWSRIGVVIGFVVLVAVGTWLTAWWRERSTRVAWVLAGLLVLVGAFDQSADVSDTAAWQRQASWESDSEFVGRIEALLPHGAMVFQMPYVPFPGHPDVERMKDYDLFKGVLHSTDLRWSYGAMRGRVPEWQPPLLARDTAGIVARLVAVGFEGLYIDRFGYADSGAALEASFGAHLGQEPIVSNDGRLAFFDLRAAASELRSDLTETEIDTLARETLTPDPAVVP